MNRADVAACIDHTLLSPTATSADVAALCGEAVELSVAAVCVSPSRLPLPVSIGSLSIATVCGFPSGSHQPDAKAAEAARSVDLGANEIDMVLDLGQVKAADWSGVEARVAAVRAAVPTPIVLKVIIEAGALTDDEIIRCCQAAESAGADYVKTSTGFHPSGGASLEAVRLMADTVGGRLGVKASGGISSAETAVAMIEAGATRLGTSSSRAILDGLS